MSTQTPSLPKKVYSPPRLTKYGDVRSLTQGGTQGLNEGGSSTTNKKSGSDRAIKECIVRVGMHPLGIGLYLFDYKREFRDLYGHGRQFGVMADEVEVVMPLAVSSGPQGYKLVDYAMLGVRRSVG